MLARVAIIAHLTMRSRVTEPQQHRPVDPKTGRLYRLVRSFKAAPRSLRKARLDNLALLPASLLPFKATYQAIANRQAPGTTLVVLPAGDSLPRRALERFIAQLQEQGHPVQIVLTRPRQGGAP